MSGKTCLSVVALVTSFFLSSSRGASADPLKAPSPVAPWTVKELKKIEPDGIRSYSPDGRTFFITKEDKKGIPQIYVGKKDGSTITCITEKQQPGGPKPDRFKMQPAWHPSGKWIFVAVERDEYTPPPILGKDRKTVEGMLQCGLWTNMWVVSPDGKRWHRLTDFKSGKLNYPDGYTGPAITPDGKKLVWSQAVDGNILAYWPFGRWELIQADFEESNGQPTLKNLKNITPKGMHWNEPGNFSPDGESVLLSGSTEKDAQGMDQYILNIKTGQLKNLTNSPKVWDEHGVFSPDGEKIVFMSSYPYRNEPNSSKILGLKTEFMLINRDGTGLTQLTHFREAGHPHALKNPKTGIAACAGWSADGRKLYLTTLVFPKYECWELVLEGPSGTAKPKPKP